MYKLELIVPLASSADREALAVFLIDTIAFTLFGLILWDLMVGALNFIRSRSSGCGSGSGSEIRVRATQLRFEPRFYGKG